MLHFLGLDIPVHDLTGVFSWGARTAWVLIPIAGIIWLLVASLSEERTKRRCRELIHQERMMAMQKGMSQQLEETIRAESRPEVGDHTGLLIGGIVSIGAGIGIFLFFGMLLRPGERGVMGVGMVPLFVGISLLVSWWAVQRWSDRSRGAGPGGTP